MQRKKSSHSENSVYFVTQYSTEANKIKKTVKTNWENLLSDPHLREVLPESPSIVFKRAPTIKPKLVRRHISSIRPITWFCSNVGNYRYGNCNHCENMVKTNIFIDVTSGCKFKVNLFIN